MIPPALTKEEWALRTNADTRVIQAAFRPLTGIAFLNRTDEFDEEWDGKPRTRLCISYDSFVVWQPITTAELPALIALANAALPDGDPRKLTWAMVDDIRSTADGIERLALLVPSYTTTTAEIVRFRGHADALASFLPPREVKP